MPFLPNLHIRIDEPWFIAFFLSRASNWTV